MKNIYWIIYWVITIITFFLVNLYKPNGLSGSLVHTIVFSILMVCGIFINVKISNKYSCKLIRIFLLVKLTYFSMLNFDKDYLYFATEPQIEI